MRYDVTGGACERERETSRGREGEEREDVWMLFSSEKRGSAELFKIWGQPGRFLKPPSLLCLKSFISALLYRLRIKSTAFSRAFSSHLTTPHTSTACGCPPPRLECRGVPPSARGATPPLSRTHAPHPSHLHLHLHLSPLPRRRRRRRRQNPLTRRGPSPLPPPPGTTKTTPSTRTRTEQRRGGAKNHQSRRRNHHRHPTASPLRGTLDPKPPSSPERRATLEGRWCTTLRGGRRRRRRRWWGTQQHTTRTRRYRRRFAPARDLGLYPACTTPRLSRASERGITRSCARTAAPATPRWRRPRGD